MTDVRKTIVDWAKWGVSKHGSASAPTAGPINYTEDMALRMTSINVWPPKYPINADCSSSVTLWYKLAGAPDPNGNHYNGYGYTGTLLQHGTHIPFTRVVPGDLVVFGPNDGVHVAMVVEIHGPDILTITHGQPGEPAYCWVNKPTTVPSKGYGFDGRMPQTFLRFDTTAISTIHKPSDITPKVVTVPPPKYKGLAPIQFGDHGKNVRYCQTLLNKHGQPIKVSGDFGKHTFAAVKRFQSQKGLTVDGVVAYSTWQALGA